MLSKAKGAMWDEAVREHGYLGGWSVIAVLALFYRVRCKPIPQAPREQIRAWQADYYYRHQEERKAAARKRMRTAYAAEPDRIRAAQHRYYRKHREEILYRKKMRRCGVGV